MTTSDIDSLLRRIFSEDAEEWWLYYLKFGHFPELEIT